jgi:hypothetical protein
VTLLALAPIPLLCGGGRRVADPALRASGLTYRYPEASTDALSAIDLRVEPASLW